MTSQFEKSALTLEFYARKYLAIISISLGILSLVAILLITQHYGNAFLELSNSSQEARNRFDACVIDWLIENTNTQAWDYYRNSAEAQCVGWLK